MNPRGRLGLRPSDRIGSAKRHARRRTNPVLREDLLFLKDLIKAGRVTPVISKTFPPNEAPRALSDAEEGHGCGKSVITA